MVMEQTVPIYTRPMTACTSGNAAFDFKAHIDFVTSGCVITSIPLYRWVCSCVFYEISYWGTCRHCNTFIALLVAQQDFLLIPGQSRTNLLLWTYRESKQNCLKLWFPSKQGAFYHWVSLQCFLVKLWNFLWLSLYTLGKATWHCKEVIHGCL